MTTKFLLAIFAASFGVVSESYGQYFEIDLAANDIKYSSDTGMLYATVPSSAGLPYGNSLVEISPASGEIVDSIFAGSEPGPIGMSSDGSIAYIGLSGANAVRPVNIVTLAAGTQFSLGSLMFYGPFHAEDIAVMPNAVGTIAVSMLTNGSAGSVAIFDNGVMRGTIDGTTPFSNSIGFGSASDRFYGYDNQDTNFGLSRYFLGASGITSTTYVTQVITGFDFKIIVDNDLIYSTSGAVVDSQTLQLMGTYNSFGAMAVDDPTSAVMFVHQNHAGQTNIEVFDRDTFVPLFSVPVVSTGGGVAIASTGCGSQCIAMVFDSNRILVFPKVSQLIFKNGFD